MRRLFVAATRAPPSSLAARDRRGRHAARAGRRPRAASVRARAAADGRARQGAFVPLGARLAGGTTVSGTVYNSTHSVLGGVAMEW